MGIRISHIEAKGLHLELGEAGKESIITRHMEDILCLFMTSGCKTVVFEDIDRFSNIGIFTKLREINLILNSDKSSRKAKEPIRFIYALKDDLFVDETKKTKFFDFIIPVVPVINASNSHDALIKLIPTEEPGLVQDPDRAEKIKEKVRQFAQDIEPFLSDMRLLKNFRNEFAIYREVISYRANPEKLLGMVVFKNFFPKDFALLHSGGGILGELVRGRSFVLKDVQAAMEQKEKDIQEKIRFCQQETATDLEHLQLAYWGALWKAIGDSNIQVVQNNQVHSIHNLPHLPGGFESVQNGTLHIHFQQRRFPKWKQIEDSVDPRHSYSERAQLVTSNSKEKLSSLQQSLDEIRAQKDSTTKKNYSELLKEGILKEDDIVHWLDHHHHHLEKNDLDLFLVLLRKGYIDENYRYYISWISANKSTQDYYFELEVRQRSDTDRYLELDNPKEVLRNLTLRDFETKSVFNLSLFKELVAVKGEKYDAMIALIARGDPDCCSFLSDYLGEESAPLLPRQQVYKEIVARSPKYVENALALYIQDKLNRGSLYPLVGFYLWQYLENDTDELDANIKKFLEDEAKVRPTLASAGLATRDQFKDLIVRAKLKFSTIDTKKINSDALWPVAEELCAYHLDRYNIEREMGEEYRGKLQYSNYSTICEHGKEGLKKYVDESFDEYIENVYCTLESPQHEEPEWIAKILNREDLVFATKQKFLGKQGAESKIPSAASLRTPDAVILALEHNVLKVTWDNLADIASRDSGDNVRATLGRFMGAQETLDQLDRVPRPVSWSPGLRRLASLVVQTPELSDEVAMALLDKMPGGQIDLDAGIPVSESRIRLLVQKHRVDFSVEFYKQLKGAKNGAHIVLGALKWKKLQRAIEDKQITIDDDEIDSMLEGDDLKPQNRAAVLEFQKARLAKRKR